MSNRSMASIRRDIVAEWPTTLAQCAGTPMAECDLPAIPVLLGSSTKIEQGESLDILSAVIYMAPGRSSGREMCAFATAECRKLCLGGNGAVGEGSGLLVTGSSKNSMLWKTALYFHNRGLFIELLTAEVRAHVSKAKRNGMVPAVRVDGTSDTGLGARMAWIVPDCQWFDYTKNYKRAATALAGKYGPNYTTVLSYTGENEALCRDHLDNGGRVAVVIDRKKDDAKPRTIMGYPVANGDAHDAVWLHNPGHVVALGFKAAKDRDSKLDNAESFVMAV